MKFGATNNFPALTNLQPAAERAAFKDRLGKANRGAEDASEDLDGR